MLLSQKLLTSVTTEMLLLGHQCLLLRHIKMSQGTNNLPVGAIWHTPRRSLHLDPPIGFPALSSCKHPAKVAFQSAAGAKGFHDKATLWVFDKPMVVRLFQGHSLAATCMKLRHCEQKRQLGILIRTMFLRNKYRTQDKVQYTHTFAESCYLDKCYLGKLGNVIDLLCFQETTKTMLLK